MNNNTTMSIFAEALASNRAYKNAHIDGVTVGVDNARAWKNAVVAMLHPAYEIRVYRHDNMGNKDAAPCNESAFYAALHEVMRLVGEVNGAKLHAKNCGEEILAVATRFRTIDITEEMANARCDMRSANKALNDTLVKKFDTEKARATAIATAEATYATATAEVKRLEAIPGNCKKIVEIQSETAFKNAVELLLGDAITKQTMRPLADVIAEKEALKATRAAKRKANKVNKSNNK